MTQLLILGMLNDKAMSGYDIQQMLKTSHADRWGGVLVGSIYHALKKLEQSNYIEINRIEQTGLRQKAIYNITEEGKKYLKLLVIKSLNSFSILYPTTLYSGLSYLNVISSDEARAALEGQKEELQNEMRVLVKGKNEKDSAMCNNMPQTTNIIFKHMEDMMQLQLDFVQNAIQIIDKGDKEYVR